MSLLTEQISSAAQNQIASQIAFFQAFSLSTFGGLEKLIALNLSIAKQSIDNADQFRRELLAVKQPQELLQFGRTHAQPELEKLLSYGRELASISRDTRAGIWQAVSHAPITTSSILTPGPAQEDAVKKTKPVSKKPPAAQPIAATKQLTLLAEPEVKTKPAAGKKAAKSLAKDKPLALVEANTTSAKKTVAKPAAVKKATPAKIDKPADQTVAPTKTETDKSLTAAVPVIAPVTEAVVKADKSIEKKPAVVPATKKTSPSTSAKAETAKAEVADKTADKKSAVKFPFAVTNKLKACTPAFPNAEAKPAYKAKSSSATGAKKRVRQ